MPNAYIDKTWANADQINYAQTIESNDTAAVSYFVFDAEDEGEALAALRAQVPPTYSLGDKTIGLAAIGINGRAAETIWNGFANYDSATGQSLGGSFYFSGDLTPNSTVGIMPDLITPEDARTGFVVAWYHKGEYQTTAPTWDIPTGTAGDEVLAIITHPNYRGELQKSFSVQQSPNLGGKLSIDGYPPRTAGIERTLTAILTDVRPVLAQTGGTFSWTYNNQEIGTTQSIVVTNPGTYYLTYTHQDFGGSLQANVSSGGGGGGGGSGEDRDTTVSFQLSQTSTLKTVFDKDSVLDSGSWDGHEIRGYNPDQYGNPQGIEFQSHDFNFSYTIYRSPSYYTQAFINRLDEYSDCVNLGPFMGFPAYSVLFAGVSGNRGGTRNSDWWGLTLNFKVRRKETVKFKMWSGSASSPTTRDEEVEKPSGHDVFNVWMQTRANSSGVEETAAVAWNVARGYLAKDFAWLAEEIARRVQ